MFSRLLIALLLSALSLPVQAVRAAGMFELQIRHFHNPQGLLQDGDCCDLQAGGAGGQRCSARDQCDTFFHACLKEYQARVVPTGTCTFGSGTTGVLGGNSLSHRHRGHEPGGGGGGGGDDGTNGHISIHFKYAWPVSTTGMEDGVGDVLIKQKLHKLHKVPVT
uniref:Notch ligand N-terminal domain-containing protein n=1 Tax=Poecilia latipinna TaxID=48699 RepID=A0A3B3VWI9_9TELE